MLYKLRAFCFDRSSDIYRSERVHVEGTPEEITKFRRELEADRSREKKEPPKGCYNDCYDENGNWLGDI